MGGSSCCPPPALGTAGGSWRGTVLLDQHHLPRTVELTRLHRPRLHPVDVHPRRESVARPIGGVPLHRLIASLYPTIDEPRDFLTRDRVHADVHVARFRNREPDERAVPERVRIVLHQSKAHGPALAGLHGRDVGGLPDERHRASLSGIAPHLVLISVVDHEVQAIGMPGNETELRHTPDTLGTVALIDQGPEASGRNVTPGT